MRRALAALAALCLGCLSDLREAPPDGDGGVTGTCQCGLNQECGLGYGAQPRCVCQNFTTWCAASRGCFDLRRDRAHCGACGNACPAGVDCVEGVCRCPAGLVACAGRCLDARGDPANCGACDNACGPDEVCRDGGCRCAEVGAMSCGGRCVSVLHDAAHCGECGRVCDASSTCVGGECACVDPEATRCGGRCVSLRRDASNCGACGLACEAGGVCVDGACLARLRTPTAGDRLGTRRPTFTWSQGDADVQVCADAACARVVAAAHGDASHRAQVGERLEPGVYFARTTRSGSTVATPAVAFRVDHRDVARPGLVPPTVDLDGDGRRDLVVVDDRGVWSLARGAAASGAIDALPAGATMEGDAALYPLGDANLDGFGDVALTSVGAARVLQGGRAVPDLAPWSDVLGGRVPLGDLNGDGRGDWFVYTTIGEIQYVASAYAALTRDATTRPRLGANIERAARAGDVNGDGYLDALLSAPGASPPRVWLGLGSATGVNEFVAFPPASRVAGFGARVACAGDVNGDGYADALVGVGASRVAVYAGGPEALTLLVELDEPDGADLTVSPVGDVDGDGFDDLLATSRARDVMRWLRGSSAGVSAEPVPLRDARWRAVEAFGGVGDVDGDGYDDIALGAPSADAVYVIRGAATGPSARVDTLRGEPHTGFGRIVL